MFRMIHEICARFTRILLPLVARERVVRRAGNVGDYSKGCVAPTLAPITMRPQPMPDILDIIFAGSDPDGQGLWL